MGRNQFILQSGIPKRDLVFWNKQTAQNSSIPPLYDSQDLLDAGYGYEYLSPENLQMSEATVSGGLLASDGPAYKAFIIRETDLLTTDRVNMLAKFANQGLPIIFYGGIPSQIASSTGLAQAQATLKNITSLPNVHRATIGSLATAIDSIGIQPLTKVSANGTWYTYWRENSSEDSSHALVYNDGNYSEGEISFASTRRPFFFDAWTGEQTPVLEYKVSSGYTTIPLRLAASQSVIIRFVNTGPDEEPSVHVTSAPGFILKFSSSNSSGLVAKVPNSATGEITTSDGKNHSIYTKNATSQFALKDWTLIAEKWGPPADLFDIDTVAIKVNTTHTLPELLSWPEIEGLANTSGVGYYSTTFQWNDTSDSAFIDFGRAVDTLRVRINGHELPPLDYTWAKADISEYLVKGQNSVEAVVATTMINGLVPIWNELRTSGSPPQIPDWTQQDEAGLVGTVVVVPYYAVVIG